MERFSGMVIEYKMLVLTFVRNTSHPMKIHRHIAINLHNSSRTLSLIRFIKLELFQQMFPEFSNKKFRENPSSRSRFVPRGRTDGRQADEAVVVFRDFANVFGNCQLGKIKVYLRY